ncbi:transmembrane protein, partial [Thraustotheca clavata]
RWGLNWNWRWLLAITSLVVIAIDSFFVFFTIWDVFRNQWFFAGVGFSEYVPSAARFVVASYCAVEIATAGNEGATYGLLTTVGNLASPVSSVVYKYVDSYFDVSQTQISHDTTEVRWQVSYTYFISYSVKIAALLWLFLLPPQKAQMQELKKHGCKSKFMGGFTIIFFCLALIFAVTTNFMSIFPSTKCYRIAGGKGC